MIRYFFNIKNVRRILLQISEIHAIFDNECNNTANLLIFVTNLSLKTAEFFIETSGSTDSKKIEKKRGQAIVHPQQTERFFLKFECPIKTKDCIASGIFLYVCQIIIKIQYCMN